MRLLYLLPLALLLLVLYACEKASGDDTTTPDEPPVVNPKDDPMGSSMVIYEVNPKVFAKTGALKAITENLDRIHKLGADVLWLMPIYPQGKKNGVGSPYCVMDYKAVNSEYGTIEDLKELVKTAHSKGMKVILDWVGNHTSWDNPWITEHPEWYTQEKGEIISPKGMGWNDVADLNYNSTEMRSAMKDAMMFWVETADVDGFRCDYTDGVPTDFWKDAISELRKKKEMIMLGESSDSKYYGSGFDMLYAWSYAGNLPKVYAGNLSLSELINIYNSEMESTPEGKTRMRYILNHDTASADGSSTSLYKSEKGAMTAFALSAFLEGVPMIYSSQELAYSSKLNFFNYVILDWTSKSAYQDEYSRLMSAYRETAKYRGHSPEIKLTGNVAALRYRTSTGKGLLIYVNTKSSSQQVNPPKELVGKSVKDLMDGSTSTLQKSMNIGSYEYRIFDIQ